MPRKKTPFIQKKHSNTYSISAGHNDFIDEKYASQGSIQKPEENGSETGARKTVSESSGPIPEQQNRKEILDLCLFDDGYDYTQHLRSVELDSLVKVSPISTRKQSLSSNASHDVSNPHIFTDRCMESEILEVIETIETIELSDGGEQETGDLEDTFFLEAMQGEKVLSDVTDKPILLSERISMSSTCTFQLDRTASLNKDENDDNCMLLPSGRVHSEESRRTAKNVQANSGQTQVLKTISKMITEEIISTVDLKSPEVKYDKTRLGEENLHMLKETFLNSPSIIKDGNIKTHPSVSIKEQSTQNDVFLFNTAIPENWRWNIRRKGEDRSEKLERKHAVKEGRRVARLAKKNLKKSFKELNQATKS